MARVASISGDDITTTDENQILPAGGSTRNYDAPPIPDGQQLLADSFYRNNVLGSVLASAHPRFTPDPNYDVIDDIRNTKYYNNYLYRFFPSQSHDETLALQRQVDEEEARDQRLASGGWAGVLAGAITGSVDPTLLLPGRVALGLAREGVSALRIGGAMAVQSLAQETALQGTQMTRPLDESVTSVGSATILGAFLGGALSWMSPAERAAAVQGLDRERAALDAHVARVPDTGPLPPSAAGAAATDTRTLDLAPTLPFQDRIDAGLARLREIPYVGRLVPQSLGLEKLSWGDVVMRALNRPSLAWRRAVTGLAEVPALVLENLEGGTTTLAGQAPLETMRRLIDNKQAVDLMDTLQRTWEDMRSQGADRIPFGEKMQNFFNIQGAQREDEMKASFSQFKSMVSDAMMNGDQHHIPQVAEAAQWIRKNVFDPWAERAEKVLPGFQRSDAADYFPHVWNRELIAARRGDFLNKLVDLFTADNATKMAAQDRIRAHANSLAAFQSNIDRIGRKLEARQARLEDDEELRDELSKFNKFAFQRAGSLRESEAPPVVGRRGGAPFETMARARINELSDRAQGHLAAVNELEDQLQAEHANAAAAREKIEAELQAWQGGSAREAQSALAARAEYDAQRQAAALEAGRERPTERLTSADQAVDAAVRRILSRDYDRPRQEVSSYANEVINHILGSPAGRLPFEEYEGAARIGPMPSSQLRGSEVARRLDVSNEFAHDWIQRDIEQVIRHHQRTFVPDTLLAERYGDVEMTEVQRQIDDDYARLAEQATTEADRTRIENQRKQALGDLAALRDRFRGVMQSPSAGWMSNFGKLSAMIRNANVMLSLGGAMPSSLGDAAGAVFRHGLARNFSEAWAPFVKSLMTNREYAKEAWRQLRIMSNATDTLLSQRHHEISGMAESYEPGSPFERTLQAGADRFNIINGLGPWTDFAKVIAGAVSQDSVYRAAKAFTEGTADFRQTRLLGESNIAPEMRQRIVEQYERHGTQIDDHMLPNTADWTDLQARLAFEAAVSRDVNISVVTPGLSRPLAFSDPALAMLLQFKGYTAAATTRLMVANLQRRDAETLSGLVASLGLGMLSYKLASIASGKPTSDRPQDWIKEAMSRANILGWLEEANTMVAKGSGGTLDLYRLIGADKPLSKFASQSAAEQLFGPTLGKLNDLAKATSAAGRGDWSAADTAALRRLVPGQNLFYTRRLFDAAEQGFNNAFGIPPQAPRR